MRVYWTADFLILDENGSNLILNKNGSFCKSESKDTYNDALYCGDVKCFIGVLEIGLELILFFVIESTVVAHLQDATKNERCPIERVDRVVAVSLKAECSLIKSLLQPPPTKLRQNTDKILKFIQDKISQNDTGILEDVLRLFNDSKDFYYCRKREITFSAQRYFSSSSEKSEHSYHWNRYMLKTLHDTVGDCSVWVCNLIQGFVSTAQIEIDEQEVVSQLNTSLTLTIISRRSTHRAGTRYLRRGIDKKSFVANFVETEVLLNIFDHELSFVQVRGSAPLFWSQKGMRYRPPLSIDRSVEETQPYFDEHFRRLIHHYDSPVVAVNLVNQQGRELQLAQCYLEHVIRFNNDALTFVSFDLHNHCRGLNFHKLRFLTDSLNENLTKVGFCWVDKTGQVVQRQKGVIRTNCVDCLDRTNLGVISQYVCLRQAQRLGLFGPLCSPPESLITVLQGLWADNGDAISTQYAGTAALKGDVTRSGERKLAGIMKDGYNSASRYYLNHAKDSDRQKAINVVTQQDDSVAPEQSETSEGEEEENLARLVSEAIRFLIPHQNVVIAGWGLVNACTDNQDVDTVVVLTKTNLYVATYELDGEKMSDIQIVSLEDVNQIQVGRAGSKTGVHLQSPRESFVWYPYKTRLFNNVALKLKGAEELTEYISSVAEQINVAKCMLTGSDSSVQYVKVINVASSSKKSSKIGSILTRIKTTGRKNPEQPSLSASSSSAALATGVEEERNAKGDDIVRKFFNRSNVRNEETVDPFHQLRPQIPRSQSIIMLL